jgi:hypothetical protein
MTEETTDKRGSSGGRKRAEKLPPEERKRIASAAATARWARKKLGTDGEKLVVKITDHPMTFTGGSVMQSAIIYGEAESPIPEALEGTEKHCPACLAGQSLEEGEGTHILATVEHPVTLPAAFADAETVLSVPEPPAAPQKPKRQAKPMPKEFKSASSYAEKRLPQAIKEKSDHVGAVARLDAEINDLVRVIKALGGNVEVAQPAYIPPAAPLHSDPRYTPQPYPVIQGATPIEIPNAPKPMRVGGAGALDIIAQME